MHLTDVVAGQLQGTLAANPGLGVPSTASGQACEKGGEAVQLLEHPGQLLLAHEGRAPSPPPAAPPPFARYFQPAQAAS